MFDILRLNVVLDEQLAAAVVPYGNAIGRVVGWDAYRFHIDDPWTPEGPIDVTGRKALYFRTPVGDFDLRIGKSKLVGEAWIPVANRIAAASLVKELARAFGTRLQAVIGYLDGRYGACPEPPLARHRLVVCVPPARVAREFDDPSVFERVWEHFEHVNGNLYGTRALTGSDPIAPMFHGNWRLARAAKAGRTKYPYLLQPQTEGERAAAAVQTDVLKWNGYRDRDAAHAFTATLFDRDRHQHVSAREMLRAREWITNGKDDDGRPVRHIRIHFPDRAAATREKRPLLDMGFEVYYLDSSGDYVQITE